MESWRTVFRAFAQAVLNDPRIDAHLGLTRVRDMLRDDHPGIQQGCTTTPPPLMCVQDWPMEAGDLLAVLGAACGAGTPLTPPENRLPFPTVSVGDAEQFFAQACAECDRILGEPAGCRWFLNHFDDSPRDQIRAELIPEIEFALDPEKPDPFTAGPNGRPLLAELPPKTAVAVQNPF